MASDVERAPLVRRVDDGERLDDGVSRRRARLARRLVTAACAGVATFALTKATGVAPVSPWTSAEGDVLGRPRAEEGDVDLTIREYRGDLHVLSWSPSGGFEARNSKGRRERVFGEDEGEDGGVKTSGRVIGASWLLRKTIEKYYPRRVVETEAPFEVVFSVSDNPTTPCIDAEYAKKMCDFDRWAPIYTFGSAPTDPGVLPTVVPATLGVFRKCFGAALATRRGVKELSQEPACEFLHYPTDKYSVKRDCEGDAANSVGCRYHGLFSMDAVDDKRQYEWDSLIPKAVWRGSDYPFLTEAHPRHKPSAFNFMEEIESCENKTAKMEELLRSDDIGPRLRAVLMSQVRPDVIDAKFYNWGETSPKRASLGFELGFDAFEHLEEPDIGRYKYHLDIGGGGGTTWSGVIPKLSMPGVLLHHETSMKDSYFDELEAWVHYIPVREDLRDVEEKITWCERHPEDAKRISDAATEWVQKFRRMTSLLKYNYRALAKPLARSLNASFLLDFETAHADPRELRMRARAERIASRAKKMTQKLVNATKSSSAASVE